MARRPGLWTSRSMGIFMNATTAKELQRKDSGHIRSQLCIETLVSTLHNLGVLHPNVPESPQRCPHLRSFQLMCGPIRQEFGKAGKPFVLTFHSLNYMFSKKFSLKFHGSCDPDPSGSRLSR